MGEKFWTYAMEEMSYPDVQEILKTTDVVLIPIGSQEKHGPHDQQADQSNDRARLINPGVVHVLARFVIESFHKGSAQALSAKLERRLRTRNVWSPES